MHYLYPFDKVTDINAIDFYTNEYYKVPGMYWCITALHTLKAFDGARREELIAFTKACQHANGGFGGNVNHDPHIAPTHYAVLVMLQFGSLDAIDTESAAKYVASLQNPDGSFSGDKWGEVDTRFSYCAVACLSLLGRLDLIDT